MPGIDVSNIHGVFGGWTASDIVAPVQDIADLAYGIYGLFFTFGDSFCIATITCLDINAIIRPRSSFSLVTPENIVMMTNWSSFYGL